MIVKKLIDTKEALLDPKYPTGYTPLPTPNHSSKICGGTEAFTSNTIFKKCGANDSLGGKKRYILKTHLERAPHIVRGKILGK